MKHSFIQRRVSKPSNQSAFVRFRSTKTGLCIKTGVSYRHDIIRLLPVFLKEFEVDDFGKRITP